MKISLDQLLASRDRRWHRQQELLREHPDETLLCLTVIMPGAVKRNRFSLVVAQAATEAMRVAFADSITWMEERDLETGFEAYAFTTHPLLDAKPTQQAHPYLVAPSVPSRDAVFSVSKRLASACATTLTAVKNCKPVSRKS